MFFTVGRQAAGALLRAAQRRPSNVSALPAAAAAGAASSSSSIGAVRNLNVHEYISMEIMQTHGIKTPECFVATTPEEAEHIFTNSLNKRKFKLLSAWSGLVG